MRGRLVRVCCLPAALILIGCSSTVGGTAERRAAPQPAPLQQGLPTAAEVSAAVGNRLDVAGAPTVGSIESLPNGIRDSEGASPLDCLGAVAPLMQVVYAGAGVQAVAWQDFARLGAGLTVSSVDAGVVRFDSEAQAQRSFERFATQWRSCAGTTVTLHAGGAGGLDMTVTDVRVDGPVLSAVILSDGGGGSVYPTEHALGVAADCIADVDVAITDPVPARRVAAGRAAALVRVMLAKLTG